MDTLIKEISKLPEITLLQDEPMSKHTTFKIGGPIRAFVYANSFDNLNWLARNVPEPLIVGNGSNLLVTDNKIERIAICTRPGYDYTPYCDLETPTSIVASAGAGLPMVAMLATSNGLSGLEWAGGIPGSLGGAVKMNAGAYGGEMKDVVSKVTYVKPNGKEYEITGDFGFAYRHSRFSDTNEIISTVTLSLKPGNAEDLKLKMRKYANQRKAKQPLDLPSAGSTFKRPENGFAAELIDKAGLKGYRIGNAQISEKHAGFIVNLGDASFDDVMQLIEYTQSEVLRQFGVELHPEVQIVE